MQQDQTTWGNKKRLILDHPELRPAEIISLAASLGVSVTRAYVSMVRKETRVSRGSASAAAIAVHHAPLERQLRQLIGELGLIRSRGIVAEMERRVA